MTFSLKPSLQLASYLTLIYSGALLCILLSSAPFPFKMAATCICIFHSQYAVRKYALLSHPNSIVMFSFKTIQEWHITRLSGKEETVHLSGSSFKSRLLLILNFNIIGDLSLIQRVFSPTVLLYNDSLSAQDLRRLRLYLNTIRNLPT